ncbi:MAG TPA: hypothetical protein VLM88_09485, partial [Proteiniclasticum sp.]|nr:hypothetical protein [Proteiniclasticum sp.]
LGTYLARRTNIAVGIISGSLTLKLFGIGMIALQISNALNTVINMVMFIAFLAFLANQRVPAQRKKEKARIMEAKEKRKELVMAR